MRLKMLFPLAVTFALTLGCALSGPSGPQTYQGENFSFQYPESWQTMAELWEDRYQPGREYYQLGVNEIIMVTSVREQGGSGVWFAVASTPLAGTIDLEFVARQTYKPIMDDLQDYSESRVTIAGVDGFEVSYRRPWGEPWWQFRDIWLANNSELYVLSFHAYPSGFETYQEDMDFILSGFAFKY